MRTIPGVRQDSFGNLYRIAMDDDGRGQVQVPYIPVKTIEYIPGSMAKLTDHFMVTEIGEAPKRI